MPSLPCSTFVSKSFLHMHLKPLHFIFFCGPNPSIPICRFSSLHFVENLFPVIILDIECLFIDLSCNVYCMHPFMKIIMETLELYVTEDGESKSIYLAEGFCTSKTWSVTDLLFLGASVTAAGSPVAFQSFDIWSPTLDFYYPWMIWWQEVGFSVELFRFWYFSPTSLWMLWWLSKMGFRVVFYKFVIFVQPISIL